MVSVITEIGFDHTDVLGDTIDKIAVHKAGIIKQGVPVVVSLNAPHNIFWEKATELECEYIVAKGYAENFVERNNLLAKEVVKKIFIM